MDQEEKNPYELEKHSDGPDRKQGIRIWTQEEQTEKLEGYLEIPSTYWNQVRYGSHIRYYTKKEGFRPGGFILKNPFDTKPLGGDEKRFMKLQNGFNLKIRGYQQWLVAYEDIAKIYMKPDASVMVSMQTIEFAVKGLNDNIRKMVEHLKKLESRISALERR